MNLTLTIGLALLAVILLILLAGAAVAVFLRLRQRRAYLFARTAAEIRPELIHLVTLPRANWNPPAAIARHVRELRKLGFRVIGGFRIPEMDDIHLLALGHPKDQLGAVVIESGAGGVIVDVMAQYSNGAILTVTTAANPGYPSRPNHDKIYIKQGTSPKRLCQRLFKDLGSRDLLPIHPSNFVAFFETCYAQDAAWHLQQMGPRDDVLRDPELDALSEPLFHRLRARDLQGVQDFLELGFSPDGRNLRGQTALMVAVTTGHLAIVQSLLDAGADPNSRAPGIPGVPWSESRRQAGNDILVTPLTLAIETGMPDVIAAILGAGANLEGPGDPPLHFASSEGDLDMVRAVFEAGADIDLNDAEGMTPLHHAALEGHVEVVEFLISMGADANARVGKQTPILLAAEAGASETVELLELYVKPSRARRARKVLEAAEPAGNARARRLIQAAMNGRFPMVRKLLAAGVAADCREFENDSGAMTALVVATRNGHVEAMRALIEAGADVNHQDSANLHNEGRRLITYALQTDFMEDPAQQDEVIRILVRHGADLSCLNDDERAFAEGCIQPSLTGLDVEA